MCAGGIEDEGLKAMAAWRRAIELSLGDADVEGLRSIAQSRTEPASRVERARILLAYREDPSFFALGRALGLHHQTVQRCVERAVSKARWQRWTIARDLARSRQSRSQSMAVWLAGSKELGYPHENCGRRGFSPATPASMSASHVNPGCRDRSSISIAMPA